MTAYQVRGFLPLLAACCTAILRVMVVKRIDGLLDEEDRVLLVEGVFLFADHESTRCRQ